MNKPDKEILNRIQGLYKKDKRYFACLADFLIFHGEGEKGMKILKENINSFPNYTSGEMVLGQKFFENKQYDKAEMLFRGALSKNDKCVKALKYLALIEEKRNNTEKQLELLYELLKYDPFDQDAKNIMRLHQKDYKKESVAVKDAAKKENIVSKSSEAEKTEKSSEQRITELSVDKLKSSEDIDVPDIPSDDGDEILKKHEFGKEVLNKERSFSEDITESLDNLTQSFINENKISSDPKVAKNDYSELLRPKEKFYTSNALDPKVDEILKDLKMTLEEYKEKMDTASKLIDEQPDNYDYQLDFTEARFNFAASSIKKEISYYTEMVKEQPSNEKYLKKLTSYKDELLRLHSELKEELNVLKNEYY